MKGANSKVNDGKFVKKLQEASVAKCKPSNFYRTTEMNLKATL